MKFIRPLILLSGIILSLPVMSQEQPAESDNPGFPLAGMQKKADSIKRKMERMSTYKTQYKYKGGEINLLPLIEAAPAPEPSLPKAKSMDVDAFYDPFIDRIKMFKNQLAEETRQLSSIMQLHNKGGEEAIKKEAYKDASQSALIRSMGGAENVANMSEQQREAAAKKALADNPIVQQMGGLDKIKSMSESERKAAAMKAVQQNPTAVMSGNDPVLAAFMQKMKNDPQYAAKYNKMSMNQQYEEYRKFSLDHSGVDPIFKEDEKNKQFEQLAAKRNSALSLMEVENLKLRTQQRMQEFSAPIIEFQQKCELALEELRAQSTGKEGYYAIVRAEARVNAMVWKLYKNAYKYAIGEFNDYIGNHWGKKNNSAGLVDVNLQIAGAIGAAYDAIEGFANDAKKQTRKNKSSQEFYDNYGVD